MRAIICPTCEARLAPEEVAEGWCETCGKKIPRYAVSGAYDPGPRAGHPAATAAAAAANAGSLAGSTSPPPGSGGGSVAPPREAEGAEVLSVVRESGPPEGRGETGERPAPAGGRHGGTASAGGHGAAAGAEEVDPAFETVVVACPYCGRLHLYGELAARGFVCELCRQAIPRPTLPPPGTRPDGRLAAGPSGPPPRPAGPPPQDPRRQSLEDPLLSIRRFLSRLGALVTVLAFLFLIAAFLGSRGEPGKAWDAALLVAFSFVIVGVPGLWCGIVVSTVFIPRRETDAFYLRSFRNDPRSWPVRVAIQEALGRRFRLSGIRDPGRRAFTLTDWLGPAFLAMRYCTPKFMDLEAGEDWKARLWNSLQRGRCVFIDVSDLTAFVAEEIRLACECVGLRRVLFVGDGSRDEAGWKALLAEHLPAGADPAEVRLAVWTGRPEDRTAFLARVRDFRQEVRERPRAGHRQPPPWCGGPAERVPPLLPRRAVQYLLGLAAIQLALAVAGVLLSGERNWDGLILTVLGGNAALFFWNWGVYIRDVGVWYERRDATIGLVAVAAVTLFGAGMYWWFLLGR